MSRVGLGRHGQLDSDAGDPLDGLVNMFDLGLVLAVAFLVAGLTLGSETHSHKAEQKTKTTEQTLTSPSAHQTASGQGRAVGQVYQLPDGQLVLVKPKGASGGQAAGQ
jgi:hypothetical protein